jgi:hypothetical protein
LALRDLVLVLVRVPVGVGVGVLEFERLVPGLRDRRLLRERLVLRPLDRLRRWRARLGSRPARDLDRLLRHAAGRVLWARAAGAWCGRVLRARSGPPRART